MSEKERLDELERQVRVLRETLASFIAWTAQSAGSPISVADAKQLLGKLDGE